MMSQERGFLPPDSLEKVTPISAVDEKWWRTELAEAQASLAAAAEIRRAYEEDLKGHEVAVRREKMRGPAFRDQELIARHERAAEEVRQFLDKQAEKISLVESLVDDAKDGLASASARSAALLGLAAMDQEIAGLREQVSEADRGQQA